MRKLDIVITMGGVGKRFKQAGYDLPKYMITAKGKTLFEWSLSSLAGFKEAADAYIFIALKNQTIDVKKFIEEKCMKWNIQNYDILLIDYLTDGQASTAMLASNYWKGGNGLLIYNIDTYIEANQMKWEQLRGDGFLPCFHGDGEHWSFVKTGSDGKAVEIKEKQKISDNCTVGAYYFKTCDLYKKLYEEYYKDNQHLCNGEKYVAPLYNYLLTIGGDIYISMIDKKYVHVLGTPEELKQFINGG